MNTVDICPVGALTSTDFRFKCRVWFLSTANSICTGCSRGCNIFLEHNEGTVYRYRPRENQDVNKWWMCDYGRLNYHYVHSDDRHGQAFVKEGGERKVTHPDDAVGRAHSLVSRFVMEEGSDKVFALISARLTNEEAFLARGYVAQAVGTPHVDLKPRTGEGDDFLLLFLPFLPLLAGQILLNSFLSDVPAVGLAGDSVDRELVERPRRWNMRYLGRFMVEFGLMSSLFEFLTFGLLLWVFVAGPETFRTGWFVESLLTELVIALVVRTRRPFWRSRPGDLLLWSSVAVVILTFAIPYLPGAALLGFTPLPEAVMLSLAAVVVLYVAGTEGLKASFYRRHEA